MEAYSLDLRERVVAACEEAELTRSEIAEEFRVSVSFVTKLLRKFRRTGSAAARPHRGGPPPALDAGALSQLADLVAKQPDATLAELRRRLTRRKGGVRVSRPTLCRALAKLDLRRKKSRCMRWSVTRRGSGANAGPFVAGSSKSRLTSALWSTRSPRRWP
jgi:transposase